MTTAFAAAAMIAGSMTTYARDHDSHHKDLYELKAEKMWRRCLQISPDYLGAHFYLSNALLMQHQLNEALQEAKLNLSQEGAPHGLALVYYAMGRSSDADKALRDLVAVASQQKKLTAWPSELARVYAFRGELDSAFAWLDRAYEGAGVRRCIS